MASPRSASPTYMEALSWKSDVVAHDMRVEHGAVGIDTDRVVYVLSLTLATPLPATALQHTPFLCLTWPLGGLWRITSVDARDRRVVGCESWRRTTMTRADLAAANAEYDRKLAAGEDVGTLFEWKMMRGAWGEDEHHWFLRNIEPPPALTPPPPEQRTLVAKLLVGFPPLEAQIEVNAVTAVDTVAQTFNADATWQVTLPGITAIREDSVLRELLDILEIDAEAFEFANINAMQEERALATSVTPAGEARFRDLTLADDHRCKDVVTTETVYHLQYSRRVVATFSEEMTLHNFPFDQQKLSFDLTTGAAGMPADGPLRLAPARMDAGRFAVANFRLGNVFHVVCHDQVFVGSVDDEPGSSRKGVSFELLLERKSGYYLTNVALIAACITYLSFVTYAPVNGDELMDTGARLQIVLTLLLTAVTFKNQVAALIPQVSYFTSLDKYVFFCFLVTCAVTIENALFPLWAKVFSSSGSVWTENSLLGISCGAFTLTNAAWGLYLKHWVDARRRAARALLEVHEYIRVITEHFPAHARDRLLDEFLAESKRFNDTTRPQVLVTRDGDLHVQLPDDAPSAWRRDKKLRKTRHAIEKHKQHALTELSTMRRIYARLHPEAAGETASPSATAIIKPVVRSTVIAVGRPNATYEAAERERGRAHSTASPVASPVAPPSGGAAAGAGDFGRAAGRGGARMSRESEAAETEATLYVRAL